MTQTFNENPLLIKTGLPPFDQIKVEHIAPAVEKILAESQTLLDQAESATLGSWDALMDPLGEIDLDTWEEYEKHIK